MKSLTFTQKFTTALLFAFALAILTIHINNDWELVHEEDSAIYTTIALSHNFLGFRRTNFHDVFYDRHEKNAYFYAHHPPLASILLALVFRAVGYDAPWVVRSLPISFQLINLALLLFFLSRKFDYDDVLFAGFVWAAIPMGAFFGRVFTQTVLASVPILVQLISYYFFKTTNQRRWKIVFYVMIVFGALIDWSPLFFSLTYLLVESWEWWKTRANTGFVVGIFSVMAFITVFNIVHMYSCGHNLRLFEQALHGNAHNQKFTFVQFIGTVLDFYRRYFTHVGFAASILVGIALARRSSVLHEKLFGTINDPMFERVMGIAFVGAMIHICMTPSYSKVHHYWYFYFMPYAVLSIFVLFLFLKDRFYLKPARLVSAVVFSEFLIMSVYMLNIRHTRCLKYSTQWTKEVREKYLMPCSIAHLPYNKENLQKINTANT